MGNLVMSGFSAEMMESMEFDPSNFPPWIALWVPLYIDVICKPLNCRKSWRNHFPSSLTTGDGWWSEKYQIVDVTAELPYAGIVSFEDFREQQGLEVTTGSGVLAGLNITILGLKGNSDVGGWLNALYVYLFETNSSALSNLLSPTGLWGVFLLVLLIRAFKSYALPKFQKIGTDLAQKAHGDSWLEDEENKIRITKFGEYVYRLLYHSTISLVGAYFFWDAPWWNKDQGGTVNLFINFPSDPVKPSMSWYYLLQASYNVDAMISLLDISFQLNYRSKYSLLPTSIGWASTVRGDFNEMLAHHIVTNALVFLSSYFRQTRIGSMVFWMHDISDVPVDICKLANFVKWHYTTTTAFFLLCAIWFATRLYVLPLTIWKSIYTESLYMMKGNPPQYKIYFYAYQPIFLILLGILIVLHLLWFSMFINMAIVLLKKGEAHDLSVHKNGEKQPQRKKVV